MEESYDVSLTTGIHGLKPEEKRETMSSTVLEQQGIMEKLATCIWIHGLN